MKKIRKFLLLLLVFAISLSFVACNVTGGGDNGGDGGENNGEGNSPNSNDTTPKKYIFSIVISDDTPYEPASYLVRRINEKLGVSATIRRYDAGTLYTENTLFVGDIPNDISEGAKSALSGVSVTGETDKRYVVKCYNGQAAIATDYDRWETHGALYAALDYVVDRLLLEDGKLPADIDTIARGEVDIIEFQQKKDEITRKEQFDKLYNQLLTKLGGDKELADEIYGYIEDIYALYTDDLVVWLANLWDPVTGGFYFSNSARDNDPYLPDIESTAQMMDILVGSGITTVDNMPDWFKNRMIAFVKGLQDPNGYFYHPQWTREMTDNNSWRRSRDVSKAMGFLNRFGVKPTYDTQTGVKGDGILADGTPVSKVNLTSKLTVATSGEVSKLIAVASFYYHESYLENAETFRAWLNTLPINKTTYDSYYYGHSLCTVSGEIVARDAELVAMGEPGLIDVAEEWLGEKQNAETGCWGPVLDFNATNGLFKILNFYNAIKRPLPNATEGLTSTMALLSIAEQDDINTVCYIFNIWCNLQMIKHNVETYGTDEDKATVKEFYPTFLAESANGVKRTAEILKIFLREDGSMSYNPEGCCTHSQGMPVAEPGSCEGDVNGCSMATVGTTQPLFRTLGLSQPKMFYKSDEIRFYTILEENARKAGVLP